MFCVTVSCCLLMSGWSPFRATLSNHLHLDCKCITSVSRPLSLCVLYCVYSWSCLQVSRYDFASLLFFFLCLGNRRRCVLIMRRVWSSTPMRMMAWLLEPCRRPTRCYRTGRWGLKPSVSSVFFLVLIWTFFFFFCSSFSSGSQLLSQWDCCCEKLEKNHMVPFFERLCGLKH